MLYIKKMQLSSSVVQCSLLLLAATVCYASPSVVLHLSPKKAMEGAVMQARCDVHSDTQIRILLYWIRQNDNERYEIATNHFVNDVFKRTGRYEAGFKFLDSPGDYRKVSFHLNITNVTAEDSGRLGCKLKADNDEVENLEDFLVAVPVQTITWMSSEPHVMSPKHVYSEDQQVQFIEGHARNLVCQVNGSYPKPEVRVMLSDVDITSEFHFNYLLVKGDGPYGLQPLYYRVEVYNRALVFNSSFYEKTLKCVATLSQSDIPETVTSESLKKNSSISIDLLYKPKFLCDRVVYVEINTPIFHLVCKVRSNPGVRSSKIYWNKSNNGSHYGAMEEDFTSNIKEVNPVETSMTLIINRVYKPHFQTYIFEAENAIGRVIHEVSLKEELPMSLSSRSTAPSYVDTRFVLYLLFVHSAFAGIVSRM